MIDGVVDLKIQTLTYKPVITETRERKWNFEKTMRAFECLCSNSLFVLALAIFFALTCGTLVFEVVLDYRERHFEVGYQPACRS